MFSRRIEALFYSFQASLIVVLSHRVKTFLPRRKHEEVTS